MPQRNSAAKRPGAVTDGSGAAFWPRLAAVLAVGGVILLFGMIVAAALPALVQQGSATPFDWTWQPYEGHFGILAMCVGSLALAGFALIFGWPLAFAIACWLLTEESRCARPCVKLVSGLVRFMTTIPTVVYGFAAVFLLTPLVRGAVGGSGMCLLSAGIMLMLLVLPTMVLMLETGLGPRLEALCPFGLALGFSRLQLLWHCVIPGAGRTLAASAVLGFGRAAGDTLLPLMLAGNAVTLPSHLADSVRSLTAHMAMVTANEVGGAAYNSLFVAGFILLLGNAVISLVLRRLCSGSAAKAAGL